jgi:hypothetical protein
MTKTRGAGLATQARLAGPRPEARSVAVLPNTLWVDGAASVPFLHCGICLKRVRETTVAQLSRMKHLLQSGCWPVRLRSVNRKSSASQ